MATFTPSKKTATDFNNGQEYKDNDGLQPATVNNLVESQLWTQALATNAPDVSAVGNVGTPNVEIIVNSAGTPTLKFSNLKGQQGVQGEKGEKGETPTLQNIMGTTPIGDEYSPVYYNGTNFVATTQLISLNGASWETINAIAQAGRAREFFKVGDEKEIVLSTGEAITVVILDFNVDDLADGTGKAKITFGMKGLLETRYPINSTETNEGGWANCEMRNSTLPTLRSFFPPQLKNIIKPVIKYNEDYEETIDDLFLLSVRELLNGVLYHSYYPSNGRPIKYDSGGEASTYWTRTPFSSNPYWSEILREGRSAGYGADNTNGVSFAFCI